MYTHLLFLLIIVVVLTLKVKIRINIDKQQGHGPVQSDRPVPLGGRTRLALGKMRFPS